jgi:hypothetical protein
MIDVRLTLQRQDGDKWTYISNSLFRLLGNTFSNGFCHELHGYARLIAVRSGPQLQDGNEWVHFPNGIFSPVWNVLIHFATNYTNMHD